MDKIRILLVDDNPEAFYDAHLGDVVLGAKHAKYFELYWVQTAEEGRWLLNAFEIISSKCPHEALRLGLPPDILIFDYALTNPRGGERPLEQRSNIRARLSENLEQFGIKVGEPISGATAAPNTGELKGKDRIGCYLGGELARAFSAYPCGAVPTTAHISTERTDAAFYEWLNEQYFDRLFSGKSRANPKWDELIATGVRALRRRFVTLLQSGVVRTSIDDLRLLAGQPQDIVDRGLRVVSRYGVRILPITALFADSLIGSGRNLDEFAKAAEKFASDALSKIFANHDLNQFTEARRLAERYLDAWDSEIAYERTKMSQLLFAKTQRPEAETGCLMELCNKFGVNLEVAMTDAREATVQSSSAFQPYPPLYFAVKDPAVQRWAVLMLAVRLEQHFSTNHTEEAAAFRQRLREAGVFAEEVSIADIQEAYECGRDRALRIIQQAGLEENAGYVRIALPSFLTQPEFFAALDPLPENVLIHGDRQDDWGTTYTNALKRLGGGKNWGPLSLNIADTLENRPFDCEICKKAFRTGEVDPKHPTKASAGRYHGVRPGEGDILRSYADECGYPQASWPAWLEQAP